MKIPPEASADGHACHHNDLLRLAAMNGRDGTGEVILEKGFGTSGDEGNCFVLIEALHREAEVELIARFSRGTCLESIDDGRVFGVSIRFRVELLHREHFDSLGLELAFGVCDFHFFRWSRLHELVEEVLHPAGTGTLARAHDLAVIGHVVADFDRSFESLQDILGPFRKGEGFVFSQVGTEAHFPSEEIHKESDDKDDRESDQCRLGSAQFDLGSWIRFTHGMISEAV